MRYILEMQNLSNTNLTAEQRRFLDEFATLLAGWNMPNNAARVYGYLLFQAEPVSLDEITAGLGISKSNAWTAAKLLESAGHCRRLSETGTKRVLFVAREDFGTPFLLRTASLGALNRLAETSSGKVANGAATKRLKGLARFYDKMQTAMEEIIQADTERAKRSSE
jgi:DNA-binding transcriptional regulator GbsR (MarR family)